MNDNINHPKHYEDAGYLVQPIDVCQELPFCLGNAVSTTRTDGTTFPKSSRPKAS